MTPRLPPLDAATREHVERATSEFHPLEVIPFFRRWPCSWQRDIVYTFIWNCGLGFAFYVLSIVFSGRNPGWAGLWYFLVIANVIGYVIHGLFIVGTASGLEGWMRRLGYVGNLAYYVLLPIGGVFLGFAIIAQYMEVGFTTWLRRPSVIYSMLFTSLMISMIIAVVMSLKERAALAEAVLAREKEKTERIEREAALANLRALQAQIEPHFLFNTLANVTGLIDPDPAKAKRMLESFIRFLRASLAATRSESTTLASEAELIGAYLDVLAIRMGARLRYAIDIEPGLAAFTLPPMLLQPVVENASRHGLEPKVDGGEIRVGARRVEGFVEIEIADTGVGFAPTTAGGMGLTNIRDRVRLLYGERGSLAVRENHPAGTVVALRIPA